VLPPQWRERLRLPAIAAPMTDVSGPELVAAACAAGRDRYLPGPQRRRQRASSSGGCTGSASRWPPAPRPAAAPAPVGVKPDRAPQQRAPGRMTCAQSVRCGAEVVVASVGSPREIVGPLHDAGIIVLAERGQPAARAAGGAASGVDGVVLLTARGRRTDRLGEPVSRFLRAVSQRYDGIVVIAGGNQRRRGDPRRAGFSAPTWPTWAPGSSPPPRASPRRPTGTPSSRRRWTTLPRPGRSRACLPNVLTDWLRAAGTAHAPRRFGRTDLARGGRAERRSARRASVGRVGLGRFLRGPAARSPWGVGSRALGVWHRRGDQRRRAGEPSGTRTGPGAANGCCLRTWRPAYRPLDAADFLEVMTMWGNSA